MATITATNQQYYAGYPAVANGNVAYQQQAGATVAAYHHHHHNQSHPSAHHHPHHPTQHQMQPYHMSQNAAAIHHPQQQHVVATTTMGANPGQQRTVSASTNSSSTAAALYSVEATKSTKGASKLRRDLINTEIAQLRELLPLPASTRQRLSQLQLMALVLVYVRKSNYFCNAFRNFGIAREPSLAIPTSCFSKALNGFLMMLTQKGKLLYISDNAAEYLGHSMEDLLSHGDEVYDIIEDQDKKTIKTELLSNEDESSGATNSSKSSPSLSLQPQLPIGETRIALCRMNVSRNARRQMRFGDQKVVLIEGHYFGVLPLSSRDEPVFLATCTPIAMPETRECVVQGSTNVFTSVHSMDMKFICIDGIGEHHLGCSSKQIKGTSWYEHVHVDHLMEAQTRHKRITSNEQEKSTILLLRMMNYEQTSSIWVHSVLQVREGSDQAPQPYIVCTNQVLSEREAQVMRSNSWLYQFYSLHSKMHGNFPAASPGPVTDSTLGNGTATPDSVTSDQDHDSCSESSKPTIKERNSGSKSTTKAPPTKQLPIGASTGAAATSPPTSKRSAEAAGFITCGADQYNFSSSQHPLAPAYKSSKLSPIIATHSPSSSSSAASATSPSAYQQRIYHRLAAPTDTISISSAYAVQTNYQGSSSLGGSSASSTASSSSSSSSSSSASSSASSLDASQSVAGVQSAMVAAAAAAAGNASLYGIDYHQAHHHHHHHHHTSPHHAQAMYAGHQHYANQMMAAQRHHQQQQQHQFEQTVQQHHHHPTAHHSHPYHQQSLYQHQATGGHQAAASVAHQGASAGLYGASSVATANHQLSSGAFPHTSAAAYHSAVAAAAQHPVAAAAAVVHQAAGNPYHQSPYHSAGAAAAAAAAAAAHQGVSFHYNKIAAAVNASA